ncbi:hypothetical protein [Chryseobacterium sp. MEBOG07]|uniref:hypothetical protein n=1 Tax=Chryseobacterium sp. MEBOG07 TaxID=2879939 RepID=UPI001F4292F8|nr:hypothetical protein [Chryseobacterium sp. MEBOG07]UKB78332.1 hypothetical protein LF886_17875 [Chryseobacterium sp. MEBOG07]
MKKILMLNLILLFSSEMISCSSQSHKKTEKEGFIISSKDDSVKVFKEVEIAEILKPGEFFSTMKNKAISINDNQLKKLIPLDKEVGNAFVMFSSDRNTVELFLPNALYGLILEKQKKTENEEIWSDGHYDLFKQKEAKGFALKYRNGAKIFLEKIN